MSNVIKSNVIKCESCQHRRECGNYYTCQHEGDKYYCTVFSTYVNPNDFCSYARGEMSDFAKDTNVPINDCISRQAAIDAHCELCPDRGKCPDICPDVEVFRLIPSAEPDVPDTNVGNCPYCHEDSDGFVYPIEKNGHAYVWHDVDGWVIDLKAKGWRGSCHIKFCPMCGRELKHG